ncbi:MAG TPA: DedA family protein [Stellaceae bacterium]|nr:DedA family protein [Stellaceae bacterium]
MIPFLHGDIPHLLATYGYVMVAGMIALEGMGVPLPGEATLILAAIIAGNRHGHGLDIRLVLGAAIVGAICGDNIGYCLGRWLGYRLLLRFGHYIGLTESRIKLGQYLFLRRGAVVVFCARFIAVLRALSGFVAGANRMRWPRFAIFNAAGGTLWVLCYGGGAYALGRGAHRVMGPIGIVLGIAALAVIGAIALFLYRNEARLTAEAERALPGPLLRPGHRR